MKAIVKPKPRCPDCNSTEVRKNGWKILKGKRKQYWQCKKCGHIFY